MEKLISKLINEGYLKTPRIIEAFRSINREDFVPEGLKGEADFNAPLPIGWGQTISQPLTVAFMLELLQPEPGDKVLDIGAGSGWQTAMLAHIVGERGRVFAIERIPELAEFGKKNTAKYSFIDKGIVEFLCADASKGLEKEAPFDKIICAAAVHPVRNIISNGAGKIPETWKNQLKIGGRLVLPVYSSIWLLIKKSPSAAKAKEGEEDEFEKKEFPGFAFVPLISDK